MRGMIMITVENPCNRDRQEFGVATMAEAEKIIGRYKARGWDAWIDE